MDQPFGRLMLARRLEPINHTELYGSYEFHPQGISPRRAFGGVLRTSILSLTVPSAELEMGKCIHPQLLLQFDHRPPNEVDRTINHGPAH